MAPTETQVQPHVAAALVTPAPVEAGGKEAGRGGGGIKVKSRTCGYLNSVDLEPLDHARLDAVKCRVTERATCAFSGSWIGCVDQSTGTKAVVATRCIDEQTWSSAYSGMADVYMDPAIHVCSSYNLPNCQTIHLIQGENTFTGFTCLNHTAETALTVTGGHWEAFAPTSIPTPINDFYHLADDPASASEAFYGTASPTPTDTPSSALGFNAPHPTVQFAGLFLVIGVMLRLV